MVQFYVCFYKLTPFVLFGIYRLAVNDAEVEGRKAWPLTALFGAGIGLAVLAWAFLLLREDRDPDRCLGKSTLDPVTGEIIPGEGYECHLPLDQIGVPVEEAETPARQDLEQ